MVEFADKTVHNMGGGMDAKSGRVMLPGRHWAKFGELDVGYACNNNRASLKGYMRADISCTTTAHLCIFQLPA